MLQLSDGEIGLLDLQTQKLERTGITIDEKVFLRGDELHEYSLLTPEQVAEQSDRIIADRATQEEYCIVPNTATSGLIISDAAYVGTKHGELHRFALASGVRDMTSRLDSFTDEERKWDLFGTRNTYEEHIENVAFWKQKAANNLKNKDLQSVVENQNDCVKKSIEKLSTRII